ncbi:MAG: hypothetical protein FWG85_02100 [Bacteroidetes bacterium]|nr:hypothetical protein [Bacteroidota bacterium]
MQNKKLKLQEKLDQLAQKGEGLCSYLDSTAILHRKMMTDIIENINNIIKNEDYERAEEKINAASRLIKIIEVNSIAKQIRDEMDKIIKL